jgi:hypothetical protein
MLRANWLTALYLTFISGILYGQDSKYGYQLPTEGTVRVLVIFAEIVQTGTCTGASYGPSDGAWVSGPSAPINADNYLDPNVIPSPLTKLSRYYKDMSLGELKVVGDYFDRTVQVPCTLFSSMSNESAINQLNTELIAAGITTTKHGLTINAFDNYQNGTSGTLRSPGSPDGNIDATVIIWRNHPSFGCGAGYGVGNYLSEPLLTKTCNLYGAWDGCPSSWATNYDSFFVAEFFHALFGGNNFHTGGGAAASSFMFDGVASFSTTAQNGSASNTVCGWDRNFMDWRGTRNYRISALDQTNTEVPADITIASHPNTSYFVLRDFVTYGDAIRIKLPHLNWQVNGDTKNQYLWIENHQSGKTLTSEFDKNKGCLPWSAGIYAYIQVGKEVISGSNIYSSSPYAAPNALKDWLFPLCAEGNFDHYYEYATENQNAMNCAWNNNSLPYSQIYPNNTKKANPFTGYNDLYGRIDSDQDGTFDAGDTWQPVFQKYLTTPNASPPNPTIPWWGDGLDAFTANGQKISIGTNPSSATVLTNTQGFTPPMQDYENETIRLNNLSVEIINNNYYNDPNTNNRKAILVAIRWDDKDIASNVRWCGNITAAKDINDPSNRNTQINVLSLKKITLDRGLSPTRLVSTLENGNYYFTRPTTLHLMTGSSLTFQNSSSMDVINGSTLHLMAGSNTIIGPNSSINIDATSYICIEPGANITFQDPLTSKIIVNGVAYSNLISLSNVILANAPNNYHAYTSITTSTNTNMPANGPVELGAGQLVNLLPGTTITPSNAGNTFRAYIGLFTIDCAHYEPLETGVTSDRSGCSGYVEGEFAFFNDLWYIHHPFVEEPTVEEAPKIFDDFTIYPNPSDGLFNLICPKNDLIKTIIVRDLAGQILEQIDNSKNLNTSIISFNLRNHSSGVMLVEIVCEKQTVIKRIVLQ